ncbi:DNA polymerase I [Deferrisoma camini]|uniref:DNA polymerase I n=1 Tax=Deferrisoma camini TaxID=1035120 RepID=UPI0004A4FEC0|nr:DNA polymerase I [Deferrisoma camini]
MARFHLVDGTNLLYRAYHAIQGLRTSRGMPTQAVYGLLTMVLKVLREHRPDGLAVVFDAPGPTQRHEAFAAYKANREETPEDLKPQIPYALETLRAMGIPVLQVEGVEADDVLGTLARRLAENGHEVWIVTGDKDFCQLVSDRIRLLDTMHDRVTDPDAVRKRFGVGPERIVDLLSLTGDAVDNLPGVPGIGVKTAAKLLERFGSLDELMRRADEVPGKRGEALRAHRDVVLANRPLVTIDTGLDLPVDPEALRPGEPDRAELARLLRELEFHRLLEELGVADVPPEGGTSAASVDTPAEWVGLVAAEDGAWEVADGREGVRACVDDLAPGWLARLADPSVPVVGHGLKDARREFALRGAAVEGIAVDTQVAAYLLLPGRRSYGFEDLVRSRGLGVEAGPGGRARTARALAAALLDELEREGLRRLYEEIENPLIPILADMEVRGIRVDVGVLEGLSREYARRLEELSERIFQAAGERFNPNSPKQLSRILFEKLKLPVVKRTATGFSTDASVLEELAGLHPLPALLLEHRSLAKLKTGFLDALPKLVDPRTGRIHTTFHQTVTATGRLSSSNPNLQNVPVRGEEGRRIREAFVADAGCVLVSADYSQVELRILAHMSRDPELIEVFRAGRDVHTETASRIFGVPADRVDSRMRREAKTVNFGILYGMSPFGLARQLGVTHETARNLIDAYFRQFAGVRTFLSELVERARRTGYAETLFGRRRPIPELRSRNRAQREFGERLAVNTPIQGTAADLIKTAMIRVRRELDEPDTRGALVLQVHDELVLEVPEAEARRCADRVRQAMEGAARFDVPLVVDVGAGPNWYEAHS